MNATWRQQLFGFISVYPWKKYINVGTILKIKELWATMTKTMVLYQKLKKLWITKEENVNINIPKQWMC